MRLALWMFLVCVPLSAQMHFGVKGGGALTDMVDVSGNFESRFRRWTVGPMIDLDLPLGLGAEFNALYRKTGYFDSTEHSANSWEFPLLIKYRFPGIMARPYISGGWAFRHLGDLPSLSGGSDGFVLGAGIHFNTPIMKIAPEMRFTRWDSATQITPGIRSARNQFEVLVGLTF